jgi:hypothetical protein
MADLTDTFYAAEGSRHGYGAQLMVGDGASPETFEAVAEVRQITFGEMVTAEYERTHLRSPDAHREWNPALRNSDAFALVANWRPEHESQNNAGGGTGSFTSGGLLSMWRSREVRNFKIVEGNGSPPMEIPFTGYIRRYQPTTLGPEDGPALNVEIKPINGAWHADLP